MDTYYWPGQMWNVWNARMLIRDNGVIVISGDIMYDGWWIHIWLGHNWLIQWHDLMEDSYWLSGHALSWLIMARLNMSSHGRDISSVLAFVPWIHAYWKIKYLYYTQLICCKEGSLDHPWAYIELWLNLRTKTYPYKPPMVFVHLQVSAIRSSWTFHLKRGSEMMCVSAILLFNFCKYFQLNIV